MDNNVLFIDVGHGGNDPGACHNNIQEKEWNLDVSLSMREELQRHDTIVHMSRTTDKTLSIDERVSAANKTNAMYFISIHFNSGGGDRGEVIHSISNSGKLLSENLAEEMKTVGQSSVKVYTRTNTQGKDYYGVIRNTKMKSVIVEGCFIDNSTDRQQFDTLDERKKFGVALAHAVLKTQGKTIKPVSGIDNKTPYIVSAGAYSNIDNARKEVEKLKNQGVNAYIHDCSQYHKV